MTTTYTAAISLMLAMSSFAANSKCVPAHQYAAFAQFDDLGRYARVSPDGQYVLRSFSGAGLTQVSLAQIDWQKGTVKSYNTPLSNEAFPVQGTWKFLVDTDGSHFLLSDILQQQKNARPLFKGGVSGFYTTSAELPAAPAEKVHSIRSLSWPNTQDALTGAQGVGGLQSAVIQYSLKNDRVELTKNPRPKYICGNLNSTEGVSYGLPMLSTDGTEFAAQPQSPRNGRPSMRIYRFVGDGFDCEKVDDLNLLPAKIVFGFAQPGKKSPVLFYASSSVNGGIVYFDRELRLQILVKDEKKRVDPDAFPGLTKDGRVLYGARWRDCASCPEKQGYVISDPYQSEDYRRYRQQNGGKDLKECTTEADVEAARF